MLSLLSLALLSTSIATASPLGTPVKRQSSPSASAGAASCTLSCPITNSNMMALLSSSGLDDGGLSCSFVLSDACNYGPTGQLTSTAVAGCPETITRTCPNRKRDPLYIQQRQAKLVDRDATELTKAARFAKRADRVLNIHADKALSDGEVTADYTHGKRTDKSVTVGPGRMAHGGLPSAQFSEHKKPSASTQHKRLESDTTAEIASFHQSQPAEYKMMDSEPTTEMEPTTTSAMEERADRILDIFADHPLDKGITAVYTPAQH